MVSSQPPLPVAQQIFLPGAQQIPVMHPAPLHPQNPPMQMMPPYMQIAPGYRMVGPQYGRDLGRAGCWACGDHISIVLLLEVIAPMFNFCGETKWKELNNRVKYWAPRTYTTSFHHAIYTST